MASTAVSVCVPLGVDSKEEAPGRQGKGRWLRYSMAAALLLVVLVCSLAYCADGARSRAMAASRRASGRSHARRLSATGQSSKANNDYSAKHLHNNNHQAPQADNAAAGPKQQASMGGRGKGRARRSHGRALPTSLTTTPQHTGQDIIGAMLSGASASASASASAPVKASIMGSGSRAVGAEDEGFGDGTDDFDKAMGEEFDDKDFDDKGGEWGGLDGAAGMAGGGGDEEEDALSALEQALEKALSQEMSKEEEEAQRHKNHTTSTTTSTTTAVAKDEAPPMVLAPIAVQAAAPLKEENKTATAAGGAVEAPKEKGEAPIALDTTTKAAPTAEGTKVEAPIPIPAVVAAPAAKEESKEAVATGAAASTSTESSGDKKVETKEPLTSPAIVAPPKDGEDKTAAAHAPAAAAVVEREKEGEKKAKEKEAPVAVVAPKDEHHTDKAPAQQDHKAAASAAAGAEATKEGEKEKEADKKATHSSTEEHKAAAGKEDKKTAAAAAKSSTGADAHAKADANANEALHGVVSGAESVVADVKASSAANDLNKAAHPAHEEGEEKTQDTSARDMSVWVIAGVLSSLLVLGVVFKVNQRRPRYHNLTHNSTDGGYQPPAQWLNGGGMGMEMRQHNHNHNNPHNNGRPSSYNDEYERFARLTSAR